MAFHTGDLVIVDPSLDRKGLYLELRDSSNKLFYTVPRSTVNPDVPMLVLEIDADDALVYTADGLKGWITLHALKCVSALDGRSRNDIEVSRV